MARRRLEARNDCEDGRKPASGWEMAQGTWSMVPVESPWPNGLGVGAVVQQNSSVLRTGMPILQSCKGSMLASWRGREGDRDVRGLLVAFLPERVAKRRARGKRPITEQGWCRASWRLTKQSSSSMSLPWHSTVSPMASNVAAVDKAAWSIIRHNARPT